MKNRYDNILREYNQEILDLVPYNPYLFRIAAKEINKIYRPKQKVLEIGTGEGDSALPILQNTSIKVDLLDVSKEMVAIAKRNLKEYKSRTNFICEDAYTYLEKNISYNIIFSGWTLHNFPHNDQEKLLEKIYVNLKQNGVFILMDKVYPSLKEVRVMLKKQNDRYLKYLPKKVAKEIIMHEKEDASDMFRIDEKPLLHTLKKIGFKKIDIADRVERDIVLCAQK